MATKLVNYTPWPHLAFERGDADDRPWEVVVLQGSFAVPSGEPLAPLDDQEAVAPVDIFRGEPGASGLYRAGAVATVKPRSDVCVDAVARSPEPRAAWDVSLRVGDLRHRLRVRGPHRYERGDDGAWSSTEPEPCRAVPLTYDRAYGGRFERDGEIREEPRNPLGTGLLFRDDDPGPVAAPQVVSPDDPPYAPGEALPPRGWAPISSSFAPRRDHLGTCDDDWLRTRWPLPPEDFDDAFYQAAHPDLIYPGYLRGDEEVVVEGVAEDGEPIVTRLPGWFVWALLRHENGRLIIAPAHLDSLHLDLASPRRSDHRAYLQWRAVFPAAAGFRLAEMRMIPLPPAKQNRSAA